MNFNEATRMYKAINLATDQSSKALQVFPKSSSGLISDDIRSTPEFKAAKLAYDLAFQKQREFNKWYNKAFKKELAVIRKAKYIKGVNYD